MIMLTAPWWQAPGEVHIPVGEGWEECDLEKAESGRCAPPLGRPRHLSISSFRKRRAPTDILSTQQGPSFPSEIVELLVITR